MYDDDEFNCLTKLYYEVRELKSKMYKNRENFIVLDSLNKRYFMYSSNGK